MVCFANMFISGLLSLECVDCYGWKICHRISVWPHLPLYSRAVPNHDKVRVTYFSDVFLL